MSAIQGHPPANGDDVLVIKGIAKLFKLPPKAVNVTKGFRLGPPKPAGYEYQSISHTLVINYSIAIFFVVIITVTRLGLRAFHKNLRWGLDDWFIIPGATFAVVWLVTAILIAVCGGAGHHIWDVTYFNLSNYFLFAQIGQLSFFVAVSFCKISIILFNRRLTGLTSRGWRITHYTMLAVVSLFLVATLVTSIGVCNPVAAGYGLENMGRYPDATCVNPAQTGLSESLVHIITDLALLVVPITVIAKVRMSFPMKVRLIGLFSVCILSCVGGIMRTALTFKRRADFTWNYNQVGQWTALDVSTAAIVASLPVLNPVIDFMVPPAWRSDSWKISHSWTDPTSSSSGDSNGDTKSWWARIKNSSSSQNNSNFHSSLSSTGAEGKMGPSVSIQAGIGSNASSTEKDIGKDGIQDDLDLEQGARRHGGVEVKRGFKVSEPVPATTGRQGETKLGSFGEGYPHSHPS